MLKVGDPRELVLDPSSRLELGLGAVGHGPVGALLEGGLGIGRRDPHLAPHDLLCFVGAQVHADKDVVKELHHDGPGALAAAAADLEEDVGDVLVVAVLRGVDVDADREAACRGSDDLVAAWVRVPHGGDQQRQELQGRLGHVPGDVEPEGRKQDPGSRLPVQQQRGSLREPCPLHQDYLLRDLLNRVVDVGQLQCRDLCSTVGGRRDHSIRPPGMQSPGASRQGGT